MQPSSSNTPKKIFNNQYVVKKKISSGSFGVVFIGFDIISKQDVAIKVEKEENEEVKSLDREVEVLNRLKGVEGTPKLFWSGEEQDYNILVIQLLGKDLSQFMKNGKTLSLKTVLLISEQLVTGLERIHNKGVIHRDLKPENILTGRDDEQGKIYIVDFGISKIYLDSQDRHILFKDNKSFIGTTRYASISAHKGHELGRKDDLESMIYVLIFFLKGVLPWQNMMNVTDDDRTIKVGQMKMKMDLNILCQNLPQEFILILEYLRKLTFKSEPDYDFIKQKIKDAAEAKNIEFDGLYDWSEVTPQFQKTLTILEDDQFKKQNSQLFLEVVDKQIVRQVSNKMMGSSANFLLPPEPRNRLNSSSQVSKDSRSILRSASEIMGSTNSLMPKYQPSMLDPEERDQNRKDSNQVVLQMKSMVGKTSSPPHGLVNKSSTMASPHDHKQIDNDTLAVQEFEMDENFEGHSLNSKYSNLMNFQVCFKEFHTKKHRKK